MPRSSTTQTEAERRKRSKEVYERAISAVDHNSGNKQPPLASKPSVVGTLNQAGFGIEEIHRAFTAARRNDDLFQTKDDEGRTWIGINDRWKLREKIESNLSRVDDPREEVIGLANDRVQKLRLRGEVDE
ncbi:hypothetical protein [Natrinema sp. DC36]|uniref:hypothetical protein n=1 Tax=Natrinema sp. DC36 TaxID=2878680 RepID=UPI001CF0A742|nr:hypothetical protein [Natrinema sp. DC36]